MAIAKYGSKNSVDVDVISNQTEDSGTCNITINYQVFKELTHIVKLAKEYYIITAAFRRLNKGARLIFDNNKNYSTLASDTRESMMNLYDTRILKFGNIFDIFGEFQIYETKDRILEFQSVESYPILTFSVCCYLEKLNKITIEPFWLSIPKVKNTFVFWEKCGITINGMSVTDVVIFLTSLAYVAQGFDKHYPAYYLNEHIKSLKEVGFTIHNRINFMARLILVANRIQNEYFPSKKITLQQSIQFINRFISVYTKKNQINLFSRNKSPFIYVYFKLLIIDWLQIVGIFRDWIDSVSELGTPKKSEIGSMRGILFEQELRNYLEKELAGIVTFWPKGTSMIIGKNGAKHQIDIGLIKDNTFFLIEAKIKLINSDYITGEKTKEDYLWRKAKEWLNQVDSCATIINRRTKSEYNQTLPKEIKYIVPIVCTPIVFFIREIDKKYFLTDSIPRICTPRELVEIIKTFNVAKLKPNEVIRKI